MMTQFVGRPLALAALLSAVVLVIGIAFALILMQVLGDEALEEAACRLGLSNDCLASQLEQSREEVARLERRKQHLEELHDRLARLDYASQSFVVFYENTDGRPVVTGMRYRSLIEPGQFDSGWCYISVSHGRGHHENVDVARMDAAGAVTARPVEPGLLRSMGLDAGEVEDARRRCNWGGRVS